MGNFSVLKLSSYQSLSNQAESIEDSILIFFEFDAYQNFFVGQIIFFVWFPLDFAYFLFAIFESVENFDPRQILIFILVKLYVGSAYEVKDNTFAVDEVVALAIFVDKFERFLSTVVGYLLNRVCGCRFQRQRPLIWAKSFLVYLRLGRMNHHRLAIIFWLICLLLA